MKAPAPAFFAALHFLPLEQTGRRTYPFQGYRPSLRFASGVWVPDYVCPDFYYKGGEKIPDHVEIPGDVDAAMFTWTDEVLPVLRVEVKTGAKFLLTEGPFLQYLVGVGRVTSPGPYLGAEVIPISGGDG